MNIKELREGMERINWECSGNPNWDEEQAHVKIDELLLEYINDSEVTRLFKVLDKWYA